MQLTESDKALLVNIQKANVEFAVHIRGKGTTSLNIDDLARYLEDKVKFEADEHGVSVEQFNRWLDFEYGERDCISITKRGTPCKGRVRPCYDPRLFVDGVTNCCDTHSRLGLTYERRGD
jgi:hypothetical protein